MIPLLLASAAAAPGRESAVLPGTETLDAGSAHAGFSLYGTIIGWHALGGMHLGIAPAKGSMVEIQVVQAPDAPWRRAGTLSVRQTLVDEQGFALALWLAAAGFEDFTGDRELVLAGSLGTALRLGGPDRWVDVSVTPASLLLERPHARSFDDPFVFPTLFVFSAGWNRRISDSVRLRTGWPEGVGVHWRSDVAYVDLSAMALGAPFWGNIEVGARF